MADTPGFVHPYIPNSEPSARSKALEAIGVQDIEELYASIPEDLRFKGLLDLPAPIRSEFALRRHMEAIVAKNRSARDNLNFLGAGCWQHYVPAVCDEVANRGEFLTSYGGGPYGDHGKHQAIFEFQSMIGELVGMEMVSAPTYDWGAAASSSVLMACRITGRREVIVPQILSADRVSQMHNFVRPAARLTTVSCEAASGLMDLEDLRARVSSDTAAVYIENPTYLGGIETQAGEISEIAHAAGALSIVGVDPITLGVLAPPSDYGADIVCGDAQPLGIHMSDGGGLCGFIASRDEERFVEEYPTMLVSAHRSEADGQWTFGSTTMERTSYDKRHESTDYYGTTQWLWGITAGVYLSLMGPEGMRELGEGIMQRSAYAAESLGAIHGVRCPALRAPFFKEFVADFNETSKTVAAINKALLDRGIFGGKDLSEEFPDMGQSALYCVTEVHSKDDLDTLAKALEEVVV